MIDFAINVEMLYPGMDICEKIERVHAAGFQAIEFWGWQDKDLAKLKATCKHLGVKVRAFSGTGDCRSATVSTAVSISTGSKKPSKSPRIWSVIR